MVAVGVHKTVTSILNRLTIPAKEVVPIIMPIKCLQSNETFLRGFKLKAKYY